MIEARVVAESLELEPHPARDLSAAGVREPRELGEIVDRHDARHDGHADAQRPRLVDEVEVGVRVEEVLRDRARWRRHRSCALNAARSCCGLARLRMVFGIGRHLDVEPVAGFLADERHQLRGVAQLARRSPGPRAGRRAAPRCGGCRATCTARSPRAGSPRVEATHERCGAACVPGRADLEHRVERALARRAAGAVGALRRSRASTAPAGAPCRSQLRHALRRLRRVELEAELALPDVSSGSGPACTALSSARRCTWPACSVSSVSFAFSFLQLQARHLLVQVLGQHVHADRVLARCA